MALARARSTPKRTSKITTLRPSTTFARLHVPVNHTEASTANMAEQLVLRGTLEGHSGWVTSLATSLEKCVPRCAETARERLTCGQP
jgi:hypothetical protein